MNLADIAGTTDRPLATDRSGLLYVRSFLWMRTLIGFIGWALPVALIGGEDLLVNKKLTPRGSMSAYYYSGMRDIFVGSLCVCGLFLISYRVVDQRADKLLSTLAGFGALTLAIFPTSRPSTALPMTDLTPLQDFLGEDHVRLVHYVGTGTFIGSLAVVCFLFGYRERHRKDNDSERSRRGWATLHYLCGWAIIIAVSFLLVCLWRDWVEDHRVLITEAVADLAFGVSWFLKGLDLRYLLGAPPPPGT